MFYCKDKDNMPLGIKLIYNAVVSDSERIFAFMVTNKLFALEGRLRKGCDLCKGPVKEFPVGVMEGFQVGRGLLRKFDAINHSIRNLDLKSFRETVFPAFTCFFARPIASLSSLEERISRVSISPSNS